MSSIIEIIRDINRKIVEEGISINNTREIQNLFIEIKRCDLFLDINQEEKDVGEYYDKYIGSWKDRLKLEHDHYKFLESFIIHKIGEVRYFHKQENLTSRKFVIWSSDCIASIQFLHRPDINKNFLNVFIRSSDAINLLPADLTFMWIILDKILERFQLEKNLDDTVSYFITSCHHYDKDYNIITEVLKE